MSMLPEVTAMLESFRVADGTASVTWPSGRTDTVSGASGERVQLAGEGPITACVDFERSPAVLYVNVAVPEGGYAGCSCSKFGVQVPLGVHA